MGFQCGLVGLPNVGKSTLFNALMKTGQAQAENYPFCTIDPNVGRVSVPDERLEKLAKMAQSQRCLPAQLDVVDIAGLVRGASQGEGLGNQFLGHIREVNAIFHVLRCFEDGDITHVSDTIDPLRDEEVIETELLLADIQSLEKRQQSLKKKRASKDPDVEALDEVIQCVMPQVKEGTPARSIEVPESCKKAFESLNLLTAKPLVYVCNVHEDEAATGNEWTKRLQERACEKNTQCVVVSASIEAEIARITEASERQSFLESLDLRSSGLDALIQSGYDILSLLTFYTVGPKESRAWTIRQGLKAPQAAGVIHTDFERGFICAETLSYEDYIAFGGEQKAKNAGKVRQEGRDYVVQDRDIFHFRFNV